MPKLRRDELKKPRKKPLIQIAINQNHFCMFKINHHSKDQTFDEI